MLNPVIILAPPRSFTSVVSTMLGQHPQLYGVPELNLFIAESMKEQQALVKHPRFLNDGLLRTIAQVFAGEQTTQTVMLAQRWIDIRINCTSISVFKELVQALEPKMIVEKSPSTASEIEHIYRIWRAFPNARFIHLLRHPLTMGESLWKMGGRVALNTMGEDDYSVDPPIKDFQRFWYKTHLNIATFLDALPEHQWMRILGEQLLAEPGEYLYQIADWLSIRTDDRAIEAMKHPENSPYAKIGPRNARFGSDPGFLRAPAFRTSPVRPMSLDTPLKWRPDGAGFSDEIKEFAQEMGYE